MIGSESPRERRLDQKAVPDNIKALLTTEQLLTVARLEGFCPVCQPDPIQSLGGIT